MGETGVRLKDTPNGPPDYPDYPGRSPRIQDTGADGQRMPDSPPSTTKAAGEQPLPRACLAKKLRQTYTKKKMEQITLKPGGVEGGGGPINYVLC